MRVSTRGGKMANGFNFAPYQQFNRVQPQTDAFGNIMSSIQHGNMMDQRRAEQQDRNMLSQVNQQQRQQELNRLDRQQTRMSKKQEFEQVRDMLQEEGKIIGGVFSRVQNENDYQMAREFTQAKFTEIYGPEIADSKMQYIPTEYKPKYVKKIVEWYRGVFDDPKEYDKITLVGKGGREKIKYTKKGEDVQLDPGESTLEKYKADQSAAVSREKTKTPKGGDTYKKSQKIDDTRSYYKDLARQYTYSDGTVIEGKEQEYKDLMKQQRDDLRKINKGQDPSWLAEPTGPQGKIIKRGMHKDGYPVVMYENGFIAKEFHRRDRQH